MNTIAGLFYHHGGISKIFVTCEEVPGKRYLHLSITTYEDAESTRIANKVPERGTEFSLTNSFYYTLVIFLFTFNV
jgi:hypothetical protein